MVFNNKKQNFAASNKLFAFQDFSRYLRFTDNQSNTYLLPNLMDAVHPYFSKVSHLRSLCYSTDAMKKMMNANLKKLSYDRNCDWVYMKTSIPTIHICQLGFTKCKAEQPLQSMKLIGKGAKNLNYRHSSRCKTL